MYYLLALAATAVVTAIANEVVQKKTGLPLHHHAFGWWCNLRDTARKWAMNRPGLAIARYIGRVTFALDNAAVWGMNKLCFRVRAVDTAGVEHEVETLVLSRDELLNKFPQLRHQTVTPLDMSV